ncbi:MAG TPA: sulfatase [Solirubrobacterales bacterium]|nr:sulfatase [Solirubrobacterales bacterium]
MTAPRAALALLAVLALALLAAGGPFGGAVAAAQGGGKPPNIILVVTDDQPLEAFNSAVMPRTARRLARRGTAFENAVVTTPQCCPSRATLLTGQYGHNHGLLDNDPGWPALEAKNNTLPNWLRAAGYRTAHVGKWLHHYGERTERRNAVGPGWSQWQTFLTLDYYDYRLRVNGRSVRYGDEPADHLTRVLNRRATGIVKRSLPKRKPLYLQLDHVAPHRGDGGSGRCRRSAVPDPRDRKLFRKQPLPRPPSFNEADVSDKPSFASERPPLGGKQIASIRRKYRCALASLRAVDRGIGKLVRAVRRSGERRNTAIIFTSDNGFFAGEHRMARGKVLPYEESIRVPLVMVLPRRLTGAAGQPNVVAEPVANVDLAPTILELARAQPCRRGQCRTLDGRSLAGLALGSDESWPEDRAIAVEFSTPSRAGRPNGIFTCAYTGLWTGERVFVDHMRIPDPESGFACEPSPGVEELYHLAADPFQLNNLAFTDPAGSAAERAELRDRLDALRSCAGVAGRDPAPPDGANCE